VNIASLLNDTPFSSLFPHISNTFSHNASCTNTCVLIFGEITESKLQKDRPEKVAKFATPV